MENENKNSKKRVLLYYLILAACLLVVAAVTVTLVLTVGKRTPSTLNNTEQSGDDEANRPSGGNKPDDNKPDNSKPDDSKPGNTPDDNKPDDKPDDKPTTSDSQFCLPVSEASVTCGYEFAFDKTLDRYAVHQGMDFEAAAGESVYAALDGTVTKIVSDHVLNENYVTISHSNGVSTTYKYIVADENLQVGDKVKRGDKIGEIATAGGMEMGQGEHLHFEVSVNGKTADPDAYLDIAEK